jgi:hypothetical protein
MLRRGTNPPGARTLSAAEGVHLVPRLSIVKTGPAEVTSLVRGAEPSSESAGVGARVPYDADALMTLYRLVWAEHVAACRPEPPEAT